MIRKSLTLTLLVVTASIILAVPSFHSAAQSDMAVVKHSSAPVRTHPSQGEVREITDGQAELFATESGITMNYRTEELEPGNVYTAWWVVINQPENCADFPCVASDILANPDTVQLEVTYADGLLASDQGKMEFAAFLPAGDVIEPWFGNGVTNPLRAEVHIVINDHGPLLPELADTMLNSYRGGCTDESLPPPFPDTAKADGTPGPNTCRLVQVAIFQQAP